MRSFLKVPIQIKDISCLITYRLTEYNFDFQCKQKIKLTCLLGYLFIQSFFTFFGLRSSWNYVIFLRMNVWRRKNDENLFFWLFLRAASLNYCHFLLVFYIWIILKFQFFYLLWFLVLPRYIHTHFSSIEEEKLNASVNIFFIRNPLNTKLIILYRLDFDLLLIYFLLIMTEEIRCMWIL